MEGTVSDPAVLMQRWRDCDLGYLRRPYRRRDGSIGYRCPQINLSGHAEPPLLTAGDDVIHLARYIKPGITSYTARDVVDYVLSGSRTSSNP